LSLNLSTVATVVELHALKAEKEDDEKKGRIDDGL
jgi:hypothetical protein